MLPPLLRKQKFPSGGCHFHKRVKQVPPGMADPRTVKDYQTHRWDKSFLLCLSALSSRAAGEGRCWSPLSGDQQQKRGNEVKLNQGKFRLDTGEGSSLGGWLVTGTGCPGISLAPGHGTKPARVQGALWLLWMTLTGTGISVRYSSKDQGIALCDPSGSLSTQDSEWV